MIRQVSRQTGRNYLLDCFRILAILMVLSVHVRGYLEDMPLPVGKLLGFGAYGVALYFLLSGYFAYSSVIKSESLKDYALKKAIRILPMYYVSLILTFVVGVSITGEYPFDLKWLYHFVFLNMFIPNQEWCWWNAVNFFWTMPAFIGWYVLSPVVFKWINNEKKMTLTTLLTLCASPFLKKWMSTFASEQFVNWNFFCLLYVFLIGALAYFVVDGQKQKEGLLYGIVIALVGLVTGNRSGFLCLECFFILLLLSQV